MSKRRTLCAVLLALLLPMCAGLGQQPRVSGPGGVKGKVRVDSSTTAEGVSVSVRQDEQEVARAETDRNGRFEITGVPAGRYSLRFRKPGLRTAEVKEFEIQANRVRTLSDKIFMPVDEGALALVKGSVFSASGHSVEGAAVELARIMPDGTAHKIDGRVTNDLGQFAFRLTPEAAHYRITAKFGSLPIVSKEIEVEGPAVYRVGLSLGAPAP